MKIVKLNPKSVNSFTPRITCDSPLISLDHKLITRTKSISRIKDMLSPKSRLLLTDRTSLTERKKDL